MSGNVHDKTGDSSRCNFYGQRLIERDGHEFGEWILDANGCCIRRGICCAGGSGSGHGDWDSNRQPAYVVNYA